MFGEPANAAQINFKWTAEDDLKKLKLERAIKLEKIRLAGGKACDSSLGGIQLVYSDGISSPFF